MIRVLSWMFGFLLVLDGGHSMYDAYCYTRRSGRKGWWVLLILSLLLIAGGIVLFANRWWHTPDMLMKVSGGMILYPAVIDALRLIWVWPMRGGKNDGEG